jgi:hypothetical protein
MARRNQLAQLLQEEWNRAPGDVKQLSILEKLGWEPEKSCSGATSSTPAPEQVNMALEQPSPQAAPEHKHWVEVYSPGKRDRWSYYRYVWMEGRKLRHRHLPGGNVDSPRAMQLKQRVELAIASGMKPEAIEELIKSCQP